MLFRSVIVNNPGDWGTVFWPLLHAEWDGWTPTDLIFPFFLFIVGTSIGLGTRRAGVATILRRGAIIWGLGLFLAAFPFFRLPTVRVTGVLVEINHAQRHAAAGFVEHIHGGIHDAPWMSILHDFLQDARRAVDAAAGRDAHDDLDRKSTRLNSSHVSESRMPSSA